MFVFSAVFCIGLEAVMALHYLEVGGGWFTLATVLNLALYATPLMTEVGA